MAIAIRHIFEPTDEGVFDPDEHDAQRMIFLQASYLEFEASLSIVAQIKKSRLERPFWKIKLFLKLGKTGTTLLKEKSGGQKFMTTGKFIKRVIFEIVE